MISSDNYIQNLLWQTINQEGFFRPSLFPKILHLHPVRTNQLLPFGRFTGGSVRINHMHVIENLDLNSVVNHMKLFGVMSFPVVKVLCASRFKPKSSFLVHSSFTMTCL